MRKASLGAILSEQIDYEKSIKGSEPAMRREPWLKRCNGWVWYGTNFARCPICRARRVRLGRAVLMWSAILGTICAVGIWR
jgi:hypothetical protein